MKPNIVDEKLKSMAIPLFFVTFILLSSFVLSVYFSFFRPNNILWVLIFFIIFAIFLASALIMTYIGIKEIGINKLLLIVFLSFLTFYVEASTLSILITFFVNVLLLNFMESQKTNEEILFQSKISKYNKLKPLKKHVKHRFKSLKKDIKIKPSEKYNKTKFKFSSKYIIIKLAKTYYDRQKSFAKFMIILLTDLLMLIPAISYEILPQVKKIFLDINKENIVIFVKKHFPYEDKLSWYMIFVFLTVIIWVAFTLSCKEHKILLKISELHENNINEIDKKIEMHDMKIGNVFSDYEIQYIIKQQDKEYSGEEIKIIENIIHKSKKP